MKIVTILGARPQFIKAAALSRVIRQRIDFEEVIVHTGQHYDENMSEVFFRQMQIPRPDYRFEVSSKRHGEMTGKMMADVEEVLLTEKPDVVLVYGDTNSTLAGALAAKKLHLKLAHVEAGLRSHNMVMPEEINRVLTDRISDYLFCPSPNAANNLRMEGFDHFAASIFDVGDIMKDVARFYHDSDVPASLELPEKFALATLHRAENTDSPERIQDLVAAFNTIAQGLPIVLPLHPRTRSRLAETDLKLDKNIIIMPPVGYLEMISLLKKCELVITDSGGLQKEAYFFSKYCVTVREETEWVELVNNGYNIVVGTDKNRILHAVTELRNKPFPVIQELYGNGRTAEKIADILTNLL